MYGKEHLHPAIDTRHCFRTSRFFSTNKPRLRQNPFRHGGSDCKTYFFPISFLTFFEFHVQLESQDQMPENPHEIRENEETSFVVQTQGVQIAKDVSVRKRWICVFDRWIRTLEYTFVPIKGTSAPPYDSSHKAGRYV